MVKPGLVSAYPLGIFPALALPLKSIRRDEQQHARQQQERDRSGSGTAWPAMTPWA